MVRVSRKVAAAAVEKLPRMVGASTQESVHHFMSPDARIVLDALGDNNRIDRAKPDAVSISAIRSQDWRSRKPHCIEIAPKATTLFEFDPKRAKKSRIVIRHSIIKADDIVARCQQHQSNDSGVSHPRDYTRFPSATPTI